MESFYAASNFTLDEDSSDNLSIKMNRSRLLLSEMGNDTPTDHHHHTSVSRHMLSSTTNLINSNSKTSSLFRKSLISTESPLLNRQQQRLLQPQQSRQSIEPEVNNTISSGVYAQFKLDSNKYIDEESNLTDLLASYSNICAENSQFLNERIQSLKLNRQKQELLNQTIAEQEDLEKEKYLWNLIHLLYTDETTRQDEEENDDDYYEQQDKENNNSIGINEIMLEKRLLKQQPLLRRIKLVIEWLEKQASESKNLNSIRNKIGEFSEKCTGWDHTLHHLKHAQTPSLNKKEKLTNLMSSREFVDELDPDAPLRQGKSLHDLDQEDEYKIMEYIYSFIRAGELNSARDFCFKIGQSWRAATLEGFKLFNDRNYFSSNGIDDQDMMTMMNDESTMMQQQQQLNNQVYLNEGNFNRDIWRLMVQRLIKDDHFTPYEKASYASLGGFVSPILPVCRTYMDFIWAYFKALYHHILEKEIQQNMSQLREFSNVPYDNDEDYFFTGLNKTSSLACLPTVQQIFDRIKILINNSGVGSFANSNDVAGGGGSGNGSNQIVNNLKTDAQNPFSIILKYIILSGIDGFKTGTCEMLDYLKTLITNNKQNGLILRFSAHLALFYKAASFQVKNETFIEINENYAQYLVDYNYKEIIAYYLSKLPNEIQIKRYSKFLQSISDNKERQHLLKLAKERNMNIQAITLNIVDNISRKSLTNGTPNRTINQTVGAAAASSLSTTSVIMNKTTDNLFSIKKTNQLLTEEDKTRINAIDWIVYDSIQRFKLLEYANLTMRYFLLERENFEATHAIFSKIPADTLTIILQQYNFNSTLGTTGGANNQLVENNLQLMLDNLPLNVTNTIKEYIGFKEYIEAVNIYNDWFEFYHREKPVKPMPKFDLDLAQTNQQQSGMDQSNIFAERIAYDYQLKQYQDLLTRWNSKAKIYCDKSRLKFYSLLKFPFLGWMVDIKQSESFNISDDDDDDDDDDNDESEEESGDAIMNEDGGDSVMTSAEPVNESKQRLKQMKNLRRVYLPNVCFVLIDMLSKMKLNKELIRVSDVVASEHYKLYTLFDTKQIKCFLNKIADASIALLDEDSDLLGY